MPGTYVFSYVLMYWLNRPFWGLLWAWGLSYRCIVETAPFRGLFWAWRLRCTAETAAEQAIARARSRVRGEQAGCCEVLQLFTYIITLLGCILRLDRLLFSILILRPVIAHLPLFILCLITARLVMSFALACRRLSSLRCRSRSCHDLK